MKRRAILAKLKKGSIVMNTNMHNFPPKLKMQVIHDISLYDKQKGVWALYGKNDAGEKWKCLQVCQTKNIGKEIREDRSYMKLEPVIQERDYISYFGNYFSYNAMPNRRQSLYIHIRKKYKFLAYVLVALEDDENKREAIERKFAIRHKAIYWCDKGGATKIKKRKMD